MNYYGGFDWPPKRDDPRGFIVDTVNNSTWRMQCIWPIKAGYLITQLNEDYSLTVSGRNNRDYVRIITRSLLASATSTIELSANKWRPKPRPKDWGFLRLNKKHFMQRFLFVIRGKKSGYGSILYIMDFLVTTPSNHLQALCKAALAG